MKEYGGDYTNDSKEGDNKSKEESRSNSNQDCKGAKSISNVSKNDNKIDNKKGFEPKTNYKPDKKPFKPERDYKPDNKPFRPKATYKPDKKPFKPERNYKPDNKPFRPKANYNPDKKSFKPKEDQKEIINHPQTQANNKAVRQKLYKDDKSRECGKCHQIKPNDEFGDRMTNGKKRLFSRCKQCQYENKQIYHFKNKAKVVQSIYNGRLEGKCQKCNTGVEKLPSLQIHHTNPELKSKNGIRMDRNWKTTKQQIEREKATILCENCHTNQRSKIYNNYKEIIQGKEFGPNATNKEIYQYIKSKLPNSFYEVRKVISNNIKKRIVINHLFKGKCVGCGKINTKNNLPALQFHHRDKNNPHLMSKTYAHLRNHECKEIINNLKQENTVVLCGNCHRMEQSIHFKNNYREIVAPEHRDKIKQYYNKIEKNIENFKFKRKEN